MKANQISEVLNQFNSLSYKSVLIDGDWGIGKTKYVLEFKERHPNSCYISLFGKKDIDSIIQELYFSIIENAPKRKLKKYYKSIVDKVNNIRLSYLGLSLSVPIVVDLYNSINKELGKKVAYIIVIDDLERKHDTLSMEEVLGLLDSLSKLANIKIVLIAATKHLSEENKIKLNNYKEKAIGRVYNVTSYAEEAPAEILGKNVWEPISKIIEGIKFANLRTFKKTSLFIEEVTSVLGEGVFTKRFTKNDLYRMCFATVFFNIEQKNEMKLLTNEKDEYKMRKYSYPNNFIGEMNYVYHYILKGSLDNNECKMFLYSLRKWFENGIHSKEIILDTIDVINNGNKNLNRFYFSEQEIIEEIKECRDFLKNLSKTQNIDTIIPVVKNMLEWSEILDQEFGLTTEEIMYFIVDNISNSIDIQKGVFENTLDFNNFDKQPNSVNSLVNSVNGAIKIEYFNQLLKKINESFIHKSFKNYYYIMGLINSIDASISTEVRYSVLKSIRENNFFFPLPLGKIDEDLWQWCRLIKKLITVIEERWEIYGLYKELEMQSYTLRNKQNDTMLNYRLNILFNETER